MKRSEAIAIHQTYEITTSPRAANYFTQDNNGARTIHQIEGSDGLARRVIVAGSSNTPLEVFQKYSVSTFRIYSHTQLNHWMDNRSRRAARSYGLETGAISGDFGSALHLQRVGLQTVGYIEPVYLEHMALYQQTAEGLRASGLGELAIKIDTDRDTTIGNKVYIVGVQYEQPNHRKDRWNDVDRITEQSLAVMTTARQEGHSFEQARYLGAQLIAEQVAILSRQAVA